LQRLFAIALALLSLALLPGVIFLVLSLPRLRHWFAQPWALTLLALLPGVWAFLLWNAERRRQALARFGSVMAIEPLLTVRRGIGALRAALLLLGLLFLGFGVAGPQWGRDWEQTAAPGRDLVVVLDCSRSMFAENPSRFERARKALYDLTTEVEKRGGHRLGLVIFAGRAELACPLTHDYDHFRATVEDLDPEAFPAEIGPGDRGISGTRIGAGLMLAVEAHDERFPQASNIVLLSDGDDPASDEEWRLGIAAAKEKNIPVYVIGLGDPNEASTIPNGKGVFSYENKEVRTRLEEEPLKRIANETHGLYIPAYTRGVPLGTIYLDTIGTLPVREASVDALPLYRQRYVWFLLPALGLLALALALPDRLPKLPRLRSRTPRANPGASSS
jgi:Ca-activated chloride channel homolog